MEKKRVKKKKVSCPDMPTTDMSMDSEMLNSLVKRLLDSSLPYEEEYFVRV